MVEDRGNPHIVRQLAGGQAGSRVGGKGRAGRALAQATKVLLSCLFLQPAVPIIACVLLFFCRSSPRR